MNRAFESYQRRLVQSCQVNEAKNWKTFVEASAGKFHLGKALLVQDDPITAKGKARRRFLDSAPSLLSEDNPQELTLVTPYLIPGEEMYTSVDKWTDKGVRKVFVDGANEASPENVRKEVLFGLRKLACAAENQVPMWTNEGVRKVFVDGANEASPENCL